ncbi:MAG: AAA family ATPase [Prevotella sp.]|uniref:DNA polymerase III subunit n=1 Tax=Prevotella sp. TaxID=59823 RepID=UPI002A2D9F07|nr:ATP-binding protein [Prevotella sp.]MDD7317185.1 AAA family ATPase [Prevotellaceae bacterium]MDY4019788.1 AAA family ATPase [Prevotella sp.]
MKFSEVIGQEETRERLLRMAAEGRVPHAMMFCGPRGCGKMALALAFASYLLCGDKEGGSDSCNSCPQCAMLRSWSHPDLLFTFPVIKPTGTPADHKMVSDDFAREWREMLAEGPYFTIDRWLEKMNAANQQAMIYVAESEVLIRKLSMKSSQGGFKVNIIWLPERMREDCANKMLKIIEEPPQQTVFIMVCEEPERLLTTIRSRVQRIDMKKIDTPALEKALAERRAIDGNMAHRIARVANGDWIKALEELDAGNENNNFLELFKQLMRLAYARNVKDLKGWSEGVAALGRERQKRMLAYFQHLVRENFMYNFRNPDLIYMTMEEEEFAVRFARFINEANVIEIDEIFGTAIRDIGQNANAKMVFYDVAMRMIAAIMRK